MQIDYIFKECQLERSSLRIAADRYDRDIRMVSSYMTSYLLYENADGMDAAHQLVIVSEAITTMRATSEAPQLLSCVVAVLEGIDELFLPDVLRHGVADKRVTIDSLPGSPSNARLLYNYDNALSLLGFEITGDIARKLGAKADTLIPSYEIPDWSVAGLSRYQREARIRHLEALTTYASNAFIFDDQEVIITRQCLLPEQITWLAELRPLFEPDKP